MKDDVMEDALYALNSLGNDYMSIRAHCLLASHMTKSDLGGTSTKRHREHRLGYANRSYSSELLISEVENSRRNGRILDLFLMRTMADLFDITWEIDRPDLSTAELMKKASGLSGNRFNKLRESFGKAEICVDLEDKTALCGRSAHG
ncbi:hypothetical protein Q9L58_000508 [Maublancomyces gigas]|uniref:Uncharacterized protein n=1 Tax=Discina gigas TaxID=1032678 RepID=A0ABR3GXA3_9PEZI